MYVSLLRRVASSVHQLSSSSARSICLCTFSRFSLCIVIVSHPSEGEACTIYINMLFCRRRQMWEGSPLAGTVSSAVGRYLCCRWVWRHTEVDCVAQASSLGSSRKMVSECPGGARMVFKDFSDNEAVRSRGQDLVSTLAAFLISVRVSFPVCFQCLSLGSVICFLFFLLGFCFDLSSYRVRWHFQFHSLRCDLFCEYFGFLCLYATTEFTSIRWRIRWNTCTADVVGHGRNNWVAHVHMFLVL